MQVYLCQNQSIIMVEICTERGLCLATKQYINRQKNS